MSSSSGRPRVFIGSSRESEKIAFAIQSNLSGFDVEVWSQGAFRLTHSNLDNLLRTLSDFGFGVFVFMPEDIVTVRGKEVRAVRDNLIFELGLFLGRLGPGRTFIVAPSSLEDLHLPSDLHAISLATFDKAQSNLVAALGPACQNIRRAIEAQIPPSPPAGDSRFAQRIAEHAGVQTANPVAVAIDLLPTSESIQGDVGNFLSAEGWGMPVEELSMQGIEGQAGVVVFVEKLMEVRRGLQKRGATEVHLFYAGPGVVAALVGVFFGNWIPVKIYQKNNRAPGGYEYWAPLEKT